MRGFIRSRFLPWMLAVALAGGGWPGAISAATKKRNSKGGASNTTPPKAQPVPDEPLPAHGPNVLLIVVEGLGDKASLPSSLAWDSPNLDRLEKQGIRFTTAEAASPFALPSRVALFSGLGPWNSAVLQPNQDWRHAGPLMGKTLLQEAFQKAGYLTAASGNLFEAAELHRDFEARRGWKLLAPQQEETGAQPAPQAQNGDAQAVAWAKEFLRQLHDRSFFLTVALNHVSPPLDKKDADFAQAYVANVKACDALVGQLLDAVAEGPHKDNTIICLVGDNGVSLGQRGQWGPGGAWEEGSHVTFTLSAPGATQPGSVNGAAVSLLDVYPTLLDLAHISGATGLDGESLVPILKDPSKTRNEPALIAIHEQEGNAFAARAGQWRLIRRPNGSEELFDLSQDPEEKGNVAGAEAGKTLAAALPRTVAEFQRTIEQVPTEKGADGSVTYTLELGDRFPAEAIDLAHRTFEMEVDFDYVAARDANATLLSQGNAQLGWALHFVEGKPCFTVQYQGLRATLMNAEALPSGAVKIRALLGLDGTLGLDATTSKEGVRGWAPMEGGFPSRLDPGLAVGQARGPLDPQVFPKSTDWETDAAHIVFRLLPAVSR